MGQTPHNKISDEKRAAIAADLKAGMTRGEAARKHGVSQATASRIASANDVEPAQPPELQIATKTFQANAKDRRAEIKDGLLNDIQRLRERAWSEYRRVVAGKDGPYEIVEPLPPLGEVRNAYAAIGVALTGYAKLDAIDAGAGVDEDAKSFMGDLMASVKAVSSELRQRELDGDFGKDVPEDEAATINVVRGEVVDDGRD